MLRRRQFLKLAGGSAAAWSFAVEAQQTLPRIGVLLVGLSPESKAAQRFRQGLKDAGYSEGRNVVIEWRYAAGDYQRVPAFIDEFVRSNVDVMVMDSTIGTAVAKRAPRSRLLWPLCSIHSDRDWSRAWHILAGISPAFR